MEDLCKQVLRLATDAMDKGMNLQEVYNNLDKAIDIIRGISVVSGDPIDYNLRNKKRAEEMRREGRPVPEGEDGA